MQQADIALSEFSELEQAERTLIDLIGPPGGPTSEGREELFAFVNGGGGFSARRWANIQALLSAAANVSKVFWPTGRQKDSRSRAAHLRSLYGMTEGSPLRSREVRNYFDHLDEQIDADKAPSHIDANSPSVRGAHRLRSFDPVTMVITIETQLELRPLIQELGRIRDRAAELS